MIRRMSLTVFAATLLLTFLVKPLVAGDTLDLTVATARTEYELSDSVNVDGSLMWVPHMVPVTDGIVGVEVRTSSDSLLLLRTRPTGGATVQNWVVNFTQFYPCDSNGAPKYSFKTGETVWIFAEWKNFDKFLAHPLMICITIYDRNSVPISVLFPLVGYIPRNSAQAVFFQASVVSDLGNYTVYACAFSDYPENGGYPYCPEQAATLAITTSGGSAYSQAPSSPETQSALQSISDGTYTLSFRLPSGNVPYGYCRVYASTYYYDAVVNGTTKFKILGLTADINGDGTVDIYDAIMLSAAYGTDPSKPGWNKAADQNNDDIIDIYDAIILSSDFGKGY